VRGTEVGLHQRRLRHFQFGSVTGRRLAVPRENTPRACVPAAVASEGRRQGRRSWAEFCALMGLDEPIDLPGLSKEARYRAVGNGVPLPMGKLLAGAIRSWCDSPGDVVRLCVCGCGRPVTGRLLAYGPACRKRMERRRRDCVTDQATRDGAGSRGNGRVTGVTSRVSLSGVSSGVTLSRTASIEQSLFA
jgi:DNA (cytosine-5)-methyltransferase 1